MRSGTVKEIFNTSTLPWVIVLAGGSGRRLLPLTQAMTGSQLPKQFCSFGGGKSLLQETLARIRPVLDPTRTLVVVTTPYRDVAREQVSLVPGITLVEQPLDRGTAPGVLLPLIHIHRRDPEATVVLLPSDHGIRNTALLNQGLLAARSMVEQNASMIVVGGVKASRASTDFGWIVPGGGPLESKHAVTFRRIEYFVEKPPEKEAEVLFRSGGLWSTFILVAKAGTLLDLFRSRLQEVTEFFHHYATMKRPGAETWLRKNYRDLPAADFSTDILSSRADLAVLAWPEDLGWADLGTPQRLIDWLARHGNLDSVLQNWTRTTGSKEKVRRLLSSLSG